MQWLINTFGAFFEDDTTPDERRAAVLNRIVMHGTPGRRTFENVFTVHKQPQPSDNNNNNNNNNNEDDADREQEALKTRHGHGDFFVLVTTKEEWQKTSGDFPRSGTIRQAIYRDTDSVDFIGEKIITDGTIATHARKNLDDSARKLPGFHEVFTDSDALLVYIHSSHLGNRVSYTRAGNPYLIEPLNKTRDPFITFDVAALIEEADKNTGQYNYFILAPEKSVLLSAYNKECARLGKRTV